MDNVITKFYPCGMKELIGNEFCEDCLGIPVIPSAESELMPCMFKVGCPALSRIETYCSQGNN